MQALEIEVAGYKEQWEQLEQWKLTCATTEDQLQVVCLNIPIFLRSRTGTPSLVTTYITPSQSMGIDKHFAHGTNVSNLEWYVIHV